jgi:protein involved in polysaccharide export with SLBB domain
MDDLGAPAQQEVTPATKIGEMIAAARGAARAAEKVRDSAIQVVKAATYVADSLNRGDGLPISQMDWFISRRDVAAVEVQQQIFYKLFDELREEATDAARAEREAK